MHTQKSDDVGLYAKGVEQDETKGFELLEYAAIEGKYVSAMVMLSDMYGLGRGRKSGTSRHNEEEET